MLKAAFAGLLLSAIVSGNAVGKEYLIKLKCDDCTPESLGYSVIKTYKYDSRLFLVEVPDNQFASVESDANLQYASPNKEIRIKPLEEAEADRDYGTKITQTQVLSRAGLIGRSDVVVAVIDTGVDYNHPSLEGRIHLNSGELGIDDNGQLKATNGIDDDGNGYIDDVRGIDVVNGDSDPIDDHDHGTHCAGIIAADRNIGHAPGVKIMPVKFLSAIGSGSLEGAIEAILYAANNGADILSNSWGGGPRDVALEDAISQAEALGTLFVAAAGNDGEDNEQFPHFPSNYEQDSVIAVASTDDQDQRSFFSNFGEVSVDVAAPGSRIFSTTRRGGFKTFSGTSMATPAVSGIAALMLSVNPDLTASEIRQILIDTVDPLDSVPSVSGGRVNAVKAVFEAALR